MTRLCGWRCLLFLLPASALAQTTPTRVVVPNGGFEQSSVYDDLWDGVDGDGYLSGTTTNVDAIAESGQVRGVPMPVSVTAGDLNGDGLVDILMADPNGYFFAYINVGTETEPKFNHAEIVSLFLSYPRNGERKAPRVNLFDWSRRGLLDLAVGNYLGEFFFLPNTGSALKPEFQQPEDLGKSAVPTEKGGGFWGNLFSPAAADLNNDGRTDLLLGEGGYSANSIHLLLNKGTNTRPAFELAGRSYLAYGNGREHLTPTLADFNGDGLPDLLVADRSGAVGVYLNPGPLWKPGTDYKFKEDIAFGGSTTLGGLITIQAADLNGDGLFDLIIGKTNGRIALALNQGTKGAPQFGAPEEIQGSDLWGRTLRSPANWSWDTGFSKGNAYLTISCVNAQTDPAAQPPEGAFCLRVAYDPSPNKVFRIPNLAFPGDPFGQGMSWSNPAPLPTNTVVFRLKLPNVKLGSTYRLNFKVKGIANSSSQWSVWWAGSKKLGVDKITRGERNTASIERAGEARESRNATGRFTPGGAWTAVSQSITFQKFANKDLADLTECDVDLEIRTTLAANQGVFYLDDVQLSTK